MSKILGKYGEDLARQYLQAKGYRILEQNFRNPLGEIDLIAQDGPTICFIEVKTRKSLRQGQPFESVHPWKIRKLSLLALSYLKYKYQSVDRFARFDVISIIEQKNCLPSIQHIKNAFDSRG